MEKLDHGHNKVSCFDNFRLLKISDYDEKVTI